MNSGSKGLAAEGLVLPMRLCPLDVVGRHGQRRFSTNGHTGGIPAGQLGPLGTAVAVQNRKGWAAVGPHTLARRARTPRTDAGRPRQSDEGAALPHARTPAYQTSSFFVVTQPPETPRRNVWASAHR